MVLGRTGCILVRYDIPANDPLCLNNTDKLAATQDRSQGTFASVLDFVLVHYHELPVVRSCRDSYASAMMWS